MSQFRRSAYLLVFFAVVAFTTSLVWNPAPPPKFVGIDSSEIPLQIGGLTAKGDEEVSPETKNALSSADIITRTYIANYLPIDFTLIGGTDRTALHDPRACLIGGGWKLEDDHTVTLPGTNVVARQCRAVDGTRNVQSRMLYLYVVDGRIISEVTQIRMEMLTSAILGQKNRPVYFVRFMQPILSGNNSDPQSDTAFHQFAADMWKTILPKLHLSNA